MKKWVIFVVLFAGLSTYPAISADIFPPHSLIQNDKDALGDISTQEGEAANDLRIAIRQGQHHIYLPLISATKIVPSLPDTTREGLWLTNGGVVDTIVPSGDRVYIAGGFSYIGPHTGCCAPVDAVTGMVHTGFPKVNNYMTAALSDGRGGWYIGGRFTQVGALERSFLAHILADGSVDLSWSPNIDFPPDMGIIDALALSLDGDTLYVSGGFTSIDGQPRNGLAALDAVTGQLMDWDPNPDPWSRVNALVMSPEGSTIYVGGYFDNIGGQSRNDLAELDAVSGQATDWDPNPNTYSTIYVLALSPDGDKVYTGGFFDFIGGQPRHNLAALDAASGQATTWNPKITVSDPDAADWVWTLAVSPDGQTIYVGGEFTIVNGQPRNHLVALDAVTGQVTNWDPDPDTWGWPSVSALVLSTDGHIVYVVGSFKHIGEKSRYGLAALDSTSGEAIEWVYVGGGVRVLALSEDGSTVYVGGSYTSIGGFLRHDLAALDASTGQATGWDPNPLPDTNVGLVNALVVSPDKRTVYVGGSFTGIGGQPRNALAALDADTGEAINWTADLDANGSIESLVLSADGNTLYAGGQFSSIGGQPRHNLAALDAASGQVTGWAPDVDNRVETLALSPDGDRVYIVGPFTHVNGQSRDHVAALDTSSGQVNDWNPDADDDVRRLTMHPDGSTVYVSGNFNHIGGQSRNHLAALDAVNGQATNWDPNPGVDGYVYAQAVNPDGSVVYIGGDFSTIGGQILDNLAVLDASEGIAAPWKHHLCEEYCLVYAIAMDDGAIYVGGFGFNDLWGSSLAVFDLPDLRIDKAVNPAIVVPGQSITYTLTFSNAGLGTASQVSIQDSIPLTIRVTDIYSRGVVLNITNGYPTYVWQVAELLPGEGGVITITGIIDPAATGVFNLTNQVEIRSRFVDANPLDNVAVVTSTVNTPLMIYSEQARVRLSQLTGRLSAR